MTDILLLIWVLPMIGCGVATIIILGILLVFLIKELKED